VGLFFLNIALAFVMFGVALDIKVDHFTNLIKKPKSAIVGFTSQTFLLPAFTFLLVITMLAANFSQFKAYIHLVFLFVLLQNGIAITTGYLFSSLFKCSQQDRRTIAIETGIQNSGLALALLFNPKIFPPEMELGGMAVIAAWWGILHIISGLTLTWYWSRRPVIA
jgi:BASS family bile acid:Na+ symporter